jgi:hypothetical protein
MRHAFVDEKRRQRNRCDQVEDASAAGGGKLRRMVQPGETDRPALR